MTGYISERLIHTLLVVIAVSAVVFILTRMLGDPALLLLPPEATDDDRARFRAEAGLDKPLPQQYALFLVKAVQGDFGQSLRHKQPSLPLVLERVPKTIQLAAFALAIALLIAIPVGIASAVWRDSVVDYLARVLALFGQSMPVFFLGIMLILVVAMQLRLLPAAGTGTPQHLILPAISLAAYPMAIISRLLRSSLLEVLNKDYIRTAHSKGLKQYVVMLRHALRNAAIPVVTVVGLQAGVMMGGAIITETVFAYPGMGLLAIQAISARDFPVVQAFVAVFAVFIALLNLTTDLLCAALDPRIRYD